MRATLQQRYSTSLHCSKCEERKDSKASMVVVGLGALEPPAAKSRMPLGQTLRHNRLQWDYCTAYRGAIGRAFLNCV